MLTACLCHGLLTVRGLRRAHANNGSGASVDGKAHDQQHEAMQEPESPYCSSNYLTNTAALCCSTNGSTYTCGVLQKVAMLATWLAFRPACFAVVLPDVGRTEHWKTAVSLLSERLYTSC